MGDWTSTASQHLHTRATGRACTVNSPAVRLVRDVQMLKKKGEKSSRNYEIDGSARVDIRACVFSLSSRGAGHGSV